VYCVSIPLLKFYDRDGFVRRFTSAVLARKISVGTRSLTAVYAGNSEFTGSASARKTSRS
jgi:hypothetical protein